MLRAARRVPDHGGDAAGLVEVQALLARVLIAQVFLTQALFAKALLTRVLCTSLAIVRPERTHSP